MKITLVIGSLRTGGAERAMVNLSSGLLNSGCDVEIVVVEKTGDFLSSVSEKVNVFDLGMKRARNSVGAFRKYLKEHSPDVIIVAQTHVQLMVLTAVKISRWKGKLILNEQSTFSSNTTNGIYRFFVKQMFGRADAITVVSHGAADDFSEQYPEFKNKIQVIANPVFTDNILTLKNENVVHPFFENANYPVILAAGRLSKEKNFIFLLRAFSLLLKKTKAYLIIIGEGEERRSLLNEGLKLGILPNVSLPGNVSNPYAYMSRCSVFALTSTYEGLPGVLIEALACGCNIVSVDCKNGPAEILSNGKFGTLVTAQDPEVFSGELYKSLTAGKQEEMKLTRARDFGIGKIAKEYLTLIDRLR